MNKRGLKSPLFLFDFFKNFCYTSFKGELKMNKTNVLLFMFSLPFVWGLLYIGFIAIVAIFFYGDSETDKAQIDYLIEKEKEERRKQIEN